MGKRILVWGLLLFSLMVSPSRADFMAGVRAYKEDDYATAIQEFRPLAEQGYAEAQYYLGSIFQFGRGVSRDDTEAAKWYRRAAEQGIAGAQYNLGVMCFKGQGLSQDYAEAAKWFRLAADRGLSRAQYYLGEIYRRGQGVPQDLVEAVKWFRLAAEQGDTYAQLTLAIMYAGGEGVPKGYVQAYMWASLAALSVNREVASQAASLRDAAVKLMTPDQIAGAETLAMSWLRVFAEASSHHSQVPAEPQSKRSEDLPEKQDYEEARVLIGKALAAGYALFTEATLLYQKQDYRGAQARWEEALKIYSSLGLEEKEAGTLTNLGAVSTILGEYGKGVAYSEQALDKFRQLGLEKEQAQTLNNLGSALLRSGDYDNATSKLKQALGIWRKWSMEKEAADTLLNLGAAADHLRQYGMALSYSKAALETFRKFEMPREEAISLLNLGKVADHRGDFGTARVYFEGVLQTFQKLGLKREEADTLQALGQLLNHLGISDEAIKHYELAQEINHNLNIPIGEAAILHDLGRIYHLLSQYDKALDYYGQAVHVYQTLGIHYEEARTQCAIADVYVEYGQASTALQLYRRYGCGHSFQGRCYLAMGDPGTAWQMFQKALELERVRANSVDLAVALIGLGQSAERLGQWRDARLYYQQAVAEIEAQRESLPMGSSERFLSWMVGPFRRLEAYEGLIRVLHQTGRDDEAFYWSEHTKARALTEAIGRTPAGANLGISQSLRTKEQELTDRIDEITEQMKESLRTDDTALHSRLTQELKRTKQQLQDLISELRREHPEYAAMWYPKPLRPALLR